MQTANAAIAASPAAASNLPQDGRGSAFNKSLLLPLELFSSLSNLFSMTSPDDLSTLLQTWQPAVVDTRDFNRSVWSRIEVVESRASRIAAFFSFFARPRIAVTAATITLFGGLFLGSLHARSADEAQYLHSLNPYISHNAQDFDR